MLRTLTRAPEDLVHGMADSEHTVSLTGATPPGRDTPEFSLANRKKLLRESLLAARSRLTEDQRKSAGIQLRDALLEMPEIGMAGAIAAYLSVGSEPDTRGLVFALWKRGAYVLLPVVRDDFDLDWASYEGPESLVPTGRLGLLEPTEPPRGIGAIASADLVIVPALAVSRDGHRLGRGGGCYDRALVRVGAAVPTVAVVYDDELVDGLPVAPHDQRVKAVAQPGRGITRLG
jgi:5-formyltetrahydrofolate cyclo-ligase